MQKIINFFFTKYGIFIIGTIIFGLFYYLLKENLPPLVFVGVAAVYVFSLRFFAERFGK